MQPTITIGLDIAKHVFQVHAVDANGAIVIRRKLRRSELLSFFEGLEPCLVGLEACATAHHWARSIMALGHQVKLMPPAYVKPYVKRQKNDAADAAAICEAVSRPSMRFVPVKDVDQQGVLVLHRTRDLLIRQRTMLINALRAHLAEFGIIMRQGRAGVAALVASVEEGKAEHLPELARTALMSLIAQLRDAHARANEIEREILTWHRNDELSRRLETIPGVGPITASAVVATVTDPSMFASGRELAAWIGLVPRQSSSGGKERLGRISKKGDPYIRRLLVVGAHSVLRIAHSKKPHSSNLIDWGAELAARKPYKLAAVALANKMARIVWALMARNEVYRRQMPA